TASGWTSTYSASCGQRSSRIVHSASCLGSACAPAIRSIASRMLYALTSRFIARGFGSSRWPNGRSMVSARFSAVGGARFSVPGDEALHQRVWLGFDDGLDVAVGVGRLDQIARLRLHLRQRPVVGRGGAAAELDQALPVFLSHVVGEVWDGRRQLEDLVEEEI